MKKGNYFQIENCIFDFKLSPHIFYVYCYLQRCNNPTNGCYPSKATIAKACGISKSTVSKAIRVLDELGVAKRQANYRNHEQINNSYILPTLSNLKVNPVSEKDGGRLPTG